MFCKTVVLTISGESKEVTCSFAEMLEKSFWNGSLLIQLLFRNFSFSRTLSRFSKVQSCKLKKHWWTIAYLF